MHAIQIKQADLTRPDHAEIFLHLLSAYMQDPKGQMNPDATPPDPSTAENLSRYGHAEVFFAKLGDAHVGMAVCFVGFSTFRNRPLLNIHDLIVLPAYRRNGAARAMLAHIEAFAREHGACKLTLEVREDNEAADRLYTAFGFAEEPVPMHFKTKYL